MIGKKIVKDQLGDGIWKWLTENSLSLLCGRSG